MSNPNALRTITGFGAIAAGTFDILLNLGFRRVTRNDRVVQYESEKAYVEVLHDPVSLEIVVLVGLLDDPTRIEKAIEAATTSRAIGRGVAEFQFGLDEINKLSDGLEEADLQPFASNLSQVEERLPQLVEPLLRLGQRLLAGEREAFTDLAERRSEAALRFTMEGKASRLRERAKKAWNEGELEVLIGILETLADDLSPAERKKLAYARRASRGEGTSADG